MIITCPQVLSSLRQKVDTFSVTSKQFDSLVQHARGNLEQREGLSIEPQAPTLVQPQRLRAETVATTTPKGKYSRNRLRLGPRKCDDVNSLAPSPLHRAERFLALLT